MHTGFPYRSMGIVAGFMAAHAALAVPLIDNLSEVTRDASILGTLAPDKLWGAQSFSSPTRFHLCVSSPAHCLK